MKSTLLFALLLLCQLAAQAQSKYGLLVGGGASFLTGKTGGIEYRASYGLSGGLLVKKTVTRRVSFESGLGYQLRRFGQRYTNQYDSVSSARAEELRRYHYLAIPLQVSYAAVLRPESELWIGGGASYGFLLRAGHDLTYDNYYREKYLSTDTYEHLKLRQGLIQVSDKPINVYSFNMSAQLHATWYWRQHYLLRAFYDYGLYDVNAQPRNGARMHLHLAGLMLGYLF